MYLDFVIPPYTIKEPTIYTADLRNNQEPFPIMCIDKDSYIVGAKLETSLNFHVLDGVHNLQIGKYSALAEEILFLMDVDKDYERVYLGAISVFQGQNFAGESTQKRKGQIIIQNDCWIANGVTIMGGVTVHNGAIIAAKSVVTKDVPPYAIVGGNPAKVIRYRLDKEQIQQLQQIAWWNWSESKIRENSELFHRDVQGFISRHIEEAEREPENVPDPALSKTGHVRTTFLFIPDFYEPYPIYEKVIGEFVRYYNGKNVELLLYIERDNRFEENILKISDMLEKYRDYHAIINLFTENVEEERSLFKFVDYYITTRAKHNVQRVCFADLFGTKCISGVDIPIFRDVVSVNGVCKSESISLSIGSKDSADESSLVNSEQELVGKLCKNALSFQEIGRIDLAACRTCPLHFIQSDPSFPVRYCS